MKNLAILGAGRIARAMIDGLIADGTIGRVRLLTANLCYPIRCAAYL